MRKSQEQNVPDRDAIRAREVVFSFKHLQENEKFSHSEGYEDKPDGAVRFYKQLIDRLHGFSRYKLSEVTGRDKRDHSHPIIWEKTSERDGFPLHEQQIGECYQLCLGTNQGRIHGFFVDNTFYIVWCDPNHRLFPGDGK